MARKFPGRKLCALVAGSGFINPDMDGNACVMRHVNGSGGRAPVNRGQPARIAMGEDVKAFALLCRSQFAEYRKPVLANGAIDLHILVGNEGGQAIGCF